MPRTVFQNPFPVPQPFNVAVDPGNIHDIPTFTGIPYQKGPTPQANPPVGPQPQTFKGVLSGFLPRKKK